MQEQRHGVTKKTKEAGDKLERQGNQKGSGGTGAATDQRNGSRGHFGSITWKTWSYYSCLYNTKCALTQASGIYPWFPPQTPRSLQPGKTTNPQKKALFIALRAANWAAGLLLLGLAAEQVRLAQLEAQLPSERTACICQTNHIPDRCDELAGRKLLNPNVAVSTAGPDSKCSGKPSSEFSRHWVKRCSLQYKAKAGRSCPA